VNRATGARRGLHAALHVAFVLMSILYLIPLLWMISTSLKLTGRELSYPPELIPDPIAWENYRIAFEMVPLALYYRNSVFISVVATALGVLTASLAGYGFAHLRFDGRDKLFALCLTSLMLPGIVTLIPEFLLFKEIGWVNTFLPLIVPWSLGGSAFAVFLFRQYALTVPVELDEAARVDGAGAFRIWWSIVLPLAKPVLATMAILGFTHHWNDFMRPLVYLTGPTVRTIAIGLRGFRAENTLAWNYLMVASLVMLAPILVLFFLAQKQFVRGIVMTGLKG